MYELYTRMMKNLEFPIVILSLALYLWSMLLVCFRDLTREKKKKKKSDICIGFSAVRKEQGILLLISY
jgi:hypothetical protein